MWLINTPEKLSCSQLCEAISVNLGDDTLDEESIPSKEEVSKCCSSLVRESPTGFELAHFTVREYLSIDSPFRYTADSFHLEWIQCCPMAKESLASN
jgi:hypothetical protein